MIVIGLGFDNICYIVGVFRVRFWNLIFLFYEIDLYVFSDYLMTWFKNFPSVLKVQGSIFCLVIWL